MASYLTKDMSTIGRKSSSVVRIDQKSSSVVRIDPVAARSPAKKTKPVRIPPEISARVELARLAKDMQTCLDWPDGNEVALVLIKSRMNTLLRLYGDKIYGPLRPDRSHAG